jgi:hypothetical protein
MKKYHNIETSTRIKATVKKDMENRLSILTKRNRLLGTMKEEVVIIPEALAKIATIPESEIDFWVEEPGEGLAIDWAKKIIEA